MERITYQGVVFEVKSTPERDCYTVFDIYHDGEHLTGGRIYDGDVHWELNHLLAEAYSLTTDEKEDFDGNF
jgi:hypothetical protein